MNIQLTEQQVSVIEKKLETMGLDYLPLQGELLDHICCMTEERMQKGQTFIQATTTVFDCFGKGELKKLQDQTIFLMNQKSNFMKKMTLAFATSFVLFIAFFFLSNEPIYSPKTITLNEKPTTCIEEKPISIAKDEPPSIRPISGNYSITAGFGRRFHPVLKENKMHSGIDIKAPIGTPVLATSDGMIIKAEHGKSYGNYIVIKHDDEYETRYAHLSQLKVKPGETISKGSVIGLVGNTGASTAPHLHYEVIKNGEKVNPKDYYPAVQRI